MMKKPIAFLAVTGFVCLAFLAFTEPALPDSSIPGDVEAILTTSCFDCHSSESSNKKAQFVLNFSNWDDYKLTKKISRLEDICTLVDEGKMPPEKYLKSESGKVLSDVQKKRLCDWTKEETEKLMEGN